MKWEGDVSGPLSPFLEYLEGVQAGDLPSLMPICTPCLPYAHLLLFHCHLCVCLWTLFLWVPSYPSVSSLPPGPSPSISGSDPSASALLYTGIPSLFPVLMAHSGLLLC